MLHRRWSFRPITSEFRVGGRGAFHLLKLSTSFFIVAVVCAKHVVPTRNCRVAVAHARNGNFIKTAKTRRFCEPTAERKDPALKRHLIWTGSIFNWINCARSPGTEHAGRPDDRIAKCLARQTGIANTFAIRFNYGMGGPLDGRVTHGKKHFSREWVPVIWADFVTLRCCTTPCASCYRTYSPRYFYKKKKNTQRNLRWTRSKFRRWFIHRTDGFIVRAAFDLFACLLCVNWRVV